MHPQPSPFLTYPRHHQNHSKQTEHNKNSHASLTQTSYHGDSHLHLQVRTKVCQVQTNPPATVSQGGTSHNAKSAPMPKYTLLH